MPRSATVAFQAGRPARPGSSDRGAAGAAQIPSLSIPEGAVAIVQGFDARGVSLGVGTGFFVTSEVGPVLVTNDHVIADSRAVYVYRRQGPRWDTLWGTVLSKNAFLDLALVQISDEHPAAMLELGNSESLGVGDPIRAVGARFKSRNVRAALNAGEVTALNVTVAGIARQVALIETDALIERGDSGGPLLNAAGKVVGVMVARENEVGAAGADRRSYAIPLVYGSHVQTLIVAARSDTFDTGFSVAYPPGYIFVMNLDPEGEGARQGLRDYDQILVIDGQRIPVPDPDAMVARRIYLQFRRRPPGTEVDLLISRANEDGVGRAELVIRFVVPGSRVP
jgi:S1-C subfamily serine protease